MEHERLETDKNHEQDNLPVIYAIHDTDPSGKEYWYKKDPLTNDRIPLDTSVDEKGRTREILSDGTLGAEVVQDPADDPERVRNLYGPSEPNLSDLPTAETSLPVNDRLGIRPLDTAGTALADTSPAAQTYANQLSSENANIRAEVNEAAPSTPPNTVEDSAGFSDSSTEYRNALVHSLNSIISSLMSKVDALRGFGMFDAARLFALKTEQIDSLIADAIDNAGNDISLLSAVHEKFFEGDPSLMLAKIAPTLAFDAGTPKFIEILNRLTTIPELTYIADKLVSARAEKKAEITETLDNATSSENIEKAQKELDENEIADFPIAA
jgi:hypothetical protein